MADGFLFGGAFTRRPSVRAVVDDSGLSPFEVGSPRVVAVVGISAGGVPKVPTLLNSPQQARDLLRSGELLEAVLRCFNPSAENPGASLVYTVRVNPATQAALTLKDGAAANAVDLKSVNYGILDNQIKVSVAAGSISGTKISVARGLDLYVKDNLTRPSFQIQYTGAGSACTLTINGTTLTTAVTGGPGGEALNITLATYPNIQSLVDFIAAQAGGVYTVSVLTTDPTQPTVNGLDFVTAQAIKASPFSVQALLQAVVDWFNSGQQPYVVATRSTGAGAPPANIAFTYLAGGVEGAVINSDWQAAVDALQGNDIAFLALVSGDATIHAIAKAHCETLSATGRQSRRAILGGVSGEYSSTLANYTTRATNLNSDRVMLVGQGVKGTDINGNLQTFPPYILAAQLCGLQAGVPEIGDPITFKSINAVGLEWVPTQAEQEILLAGGVCPIEFVENRGFYRVLRGISTWRKNDNFGRVEFSTGMALDQVVRDVIEGLEGFVGQKGSFVLVNRIASAVQSILKLEEQAGIIVGDSANPAFDSINVALSGDMAKVSFNCRPAVPLNFIAITVHGNLFSGQLSVAVG